MNIELEDYARHFQNIEDEIQRFRLSVRRELSIDFGNLSSLTDYRTVVMTTVRQEISQLNSELDVLKKFYSEITTAFSSYQKTSRRSKRSLFGFVAPLLTSIFGVANEDQLQNIKVNLNTLKRKTNNIGIALGQTLTSLNDTRVAVSRNREYLNKLSLSVRMTRRILNNALNELRDQLSVQNQLDHFIVRIHSLFHMATLSLHRIGFNLQVLKDDLHEAWKGHISSTLLSTEQFKSLLQHVRRQIGDRYTLPFPLRRISEYYRFVPTVMVLDNNVVHLAMIIPLKKTGEYFDLFRAIPIPCELNDVLHYWNIESKFLAISNDNTRFTYFANENDFGTCKLGYCIVDTPHYKTQDTPSCVLSLLNKDINSVNKVCDIIGEPLPTSVSAVRIVGIKWLILSYSSWTLHIMCDSSTSRSVEITQIVSIIDIGNDCEAQGRYLYLPKRDNFRYSSTLKTWNEMQVIQFRSFNFNISDFKLQGPSKLNMDDSDIPSILPNVDLNNGHIQKLLRLLNDDNDDDWKTMDFDSLPATHWLLIIGACVVIFIVLTVGIYCMYIGYKRRVNKIFKISSNGFEEIALHDVRNTGSGAIGPERGVTIDGGISGAVSEVMTSQGVTGDTVDVDSAPPTSQGCGHCS